MRKKEYGEKLLKMRPQLQHYACYLTCSKEKAEDLLQDTLLKTLEQAEKFKEGTNFKAWTFTIMYNLFVNDWKKWSRTLFVSDINSVWNNGTDNEENSIWDPVRFYEIQEAVNKKLKKMPEEDQKVWQLYWAGYRYDEISQVTGLVLGTVKSKIYSIKSRLRGLFG